MVLATEEPLMELWPFAVEAASFKNHFNDKISCVKEQVNLNKKIFPF